MLRRNLSALRPRGLRPPGLCPHDLRPRGLHPAGLRPAGLRPAGLRPCVLALAAVALLALSPGHADAHALVTSSEPAAGGQLERAPGEVLVRFNSRVDHARSQLLLAPAREAAGGTADERRLDLLPSPDTELRAALPPLPPGRWRLRWQVLALDGHITRGDILFELRG